MKIPLMPSDRSRSKGSSRSTAHGRKSAVSREGGPPTDDFYAPHITDPDPPYEGAMTRAESRRGAERIAKAFPELVLKEDDD
jgi:hypothetical protein